MTRVAMFKQLLSDRPIRKCDSKTTDLRVMLSKALRAERFTEALDLYDLIEKRKPEEPRWAHRKGDLLRRMGRRVDAALAYERAAHLYSAKGFDARAAATARLLLALDPSKSAVLEWVDAEATRRFERLNRNAIPLTF